MFVIDLAPTGAKPEIVEERLLFDHLVHTRAGSYLSKKHGGEFLRVSFTVSEADCRRFEDTFPVPIEKLARYSPTAPQRPRHVGGTSNLCRTSRAAPRQWLETATGAPTRSFGRAEP